MHDLSVENEWLSPRQVAELLGLGTATVLRGRGWVSLPWARPNSRTRRLRRADLEAWLAQRVAA